MSTPDFTAPPSDAKTIFPPYPAGYSEAHAPVRQAPIADMAGAAAATAALEEMAATLRAAREGGRMIMALPLDQIEAGYLVRDRLTVDPEEMDVLVESLRNRGQQSPIEVVQLSSDRFGLISGWRRLQALRRLLAETGDARFATVLAVLRKPDQASDAYVAMVEENEIRVGLSFYERARIVAKAVEAGVFDEDRTALRALFATASRAKRSKIGSFLVVVRALDGCLRFPEAIGERLGLQLAMALEANPALGEGLAMALSTQAPVDAAAEQLFVMQEIARVSRKKPSLTTPAETVSQLAGFRVIIATGRLVIEGPKADAALAARLIDWLKAQET